MSLLLAATPTAADDPSNREWSWEDWWQPDDEYESSYGFIWQQPDSVTASDDSETRAITWDDWYDEVDGVESLLWQQPDEVVTAPASGGRINYEFLRYWNQPRGETAEQRALRRRSYEIIEKLQSTAVSPETTDVLQIEAASVSAELRTAISQLQAAAVEYQRRIAEKSLFDSISAKWSAERERREQQQMLAVIQQHLNVMQQQQEELDIVFVAFVLAALE